MAPQPTISMLLPARGRPANLKASVESVFRLATEPDRVELLVRLDDCDPHLEAELDILETCKSPEHGAIRVFRGPRLGYAQMHQMYNVLARIGRGDWLFLWNDDIEMVTKGWDVLVREAPVYSIQFARRDITATTDYTLPIVGRPVFNALEFHLSMNAYVDAWLVDVAASAGVAVARDDIVFTHHRLNDQTLNEQNDGGRAWGEFNAEAMTALRRADLEKVIASSHYQDRFSRWQGEFRPVTLDYVKLASPAQAFVLAGRR